jgi:putative ABC transport system permease protein
MRTIRSVVAGLGRSPLKSTLTLVTVGLGVGVLILALSISTTFNDLIDRQLSRDGIVLMVANATIDESAGELDAVRPPEFDENVAATLQVEVAGVSAVSSVSQRGFDELLVEDERYRIRSVLLTDEAYPEVMGLDVVAGTFFSGEDVATGARNVAISQSLANLLFGDASSALGETLRSPARRITVTQDSGAGSADSGVRTRSFVMPTFTVSGVYHDPSELKRRAYGIGDMLIPYTAVVPAGVNPQLVQRLFQSTLAVRVQGSAAETAEAQIRDVLAREYGADAAVAVWEGTPGGATTMLQETRRTVNTFTIVVNLLGFILLVTGSIGILSIMLVEVLGRSREIAMERALGASRNVILRGFFLRALVVAGLSAALGTGLSLVFAGPLSELVVPILEGVETGDLSGSIVSVRDLGTGVATALVVGGVFGTFPVIPALNANIAEGMREA